MLCTVDESVQFQGSQDGWEGRQSDRGQCVVA